MARPGLTGHRKFRRLARALGSAIIARGALELLWESCYESGNDYVGTAEDIEHLVGWNGEPGMLTRAFVEAGCPEGQGFLEPVQGTVNGAAAFRVHDLWHHAPDYVAKRRQRELARQDKAAPQAVRRSAPFGAGFSQTAECQIEVPPPPSPSPSHSPSPKEICAEAEASTPVFLRFPVIGSKDAVWPLSEAQVAEWVALFPGLDVRGEGRQALAWVLAEPGRRKTARGMPRFLVGWLGRAVNSGRARSEQGMRPRLVPEWVCPHLEPCGGRTACDIASRLNRPRKGAA